MVDKKNLIWLIWYSSNRSIVLIDKNPGDVNKEVYPILTYPDDRWTFKGQFIEFGRAVLNPWEGEGTPLGAYDRTNLDHLKMLLIDFHRLVGQSSR